MTAVPAIMLEPVGNLVRVGLETASQLQRKAPAKARYIVGSGQEATITPLTPAIPWTSGFGSNANAPTATGTIDLIGSYTPWVVFLVHTAGTGTFVAGQMYVAKLTDWGALSQEGTRILVPLDIYRFHAAEYAGADLTTQTIGQHGNTIGTPLTVGTSADSASGTVTFPVPYPTGTVPDVELTSRDPAFVVALDPTHNWGTPGVHDVIETAFAYVVSRLQSLTGVSSFTESVPIGTVPTAVHAVSFMTDLGFVFTGGPAVIVTSMDTDYEATVQPATVSGSGFSLMLTYKPATPPTTAKAPTGVTVANGTAAITVSSVLAHAHSIPAGTDASGGATGNAGAQGLTATDSGHPHSINEPNSGAGHEHGPVGAPVSPGATVPCIYWVYGTRIAATASTVSIRWQSAG